MKHCVIDRNTNICVNIIELSPDDQYVPANPDHVLATDHSGEIGWTWNGSQWLDGSVARSTEQRAMIVRRKRDNLLKQTVDSMNPMRWTVMTAEQQQSWIDYRQALLDVPSQAGFPTTVIWPEKPEF